MMEREDSMMLNEYQRWTKENTFYDGGNIAYPALGLCGEAGEFADKVKKSFRDNPAGELTEEIRREMKMELGDTLFYVSMCATALGISLEEVARSNQAKIADRRSRGVLRGNGDNR